MSTSSNNVRGNLLSKTYERNITTSRLLWSLDLKVMVLRRRWNLKRWNVSGKNFKKFEKKASDAPYDPEVMCDSILWVSGGETAFFFFLLFDESELRFGSCGLTRLVSKCDFFFFGSMSGIYSRFELIMVVLNHFVLLYWFSKGEFVWLSVSVSVNFELGKFVRMCEYIFIIFH